MAEANDWMAGWMKSQQDYWKAWTELAGSAVKMPERPTTPLTDGLAQWWQAVSPMAPPAGREVFDKIMGVSKGYFALAERFVTEAGQGQGQAQALDGWLDAMRKMWTDWSGHGAHQNGPFSGASQGPGAGAFWDQSMKAFSSFMPADISQSFLPEGAMRDQFKRFLAIPAFGYTRETQSLYQELSQRQMDYAAALQAYQGAFGKLGVQTTESFRQSLQDGAKDGKTITNLRELYDQWVEMSEAAYAAFVMTPEYQTLYGRLVNTMLALRQQMGRMVDQNLEAMQMPTHAEIDTLQSRQQALRRDNLALRKEVREMRAELDALRVVVNHPAEPAAAEIPIVEPIPAEPTASARPKPKTPPRRATPKKTS